ncbi:MAG: DNA repair protein RecN [Clostridia bacterium]|nr:DNA repair protein RecN [Clostridia bacterium]
MLKGLHIENIAVISQAEIDFSSGFCVMTGQTGAGKSVIVDSIMLICGVKGDRELVRSGESSASVTAHFCDLTEGAIQGLLQMGIACDEGEVVLQRTLGADGKSQARINGKAATLGMLRQASTYLISIHGQDDNRLLADLRYHTDMLDAYAGLDALRAEYGAAYDEWRSLCEKRDALTRDAGERLRTIEMLNYQIADIAALKLKAGEEELLIEKRNKLQNTEKVQKQVKFSTKVLTGAGSNGAVSYMLERCAASMNALAAYVPDAAEVGEELIDLSYRVRDLSDRIEGYAEDLDDDPVAMLDKIEDRLEAISKLKRKYGGSVEAVLEFLENAKSRLDEIEHSDVLSEQYDAEIAKQHARALALAMQMSEMRTKAAADAAEQIAGQLSYLDMAGVRFRIAVTKERELNPVGIDRVEFMIATNPGEPLSSMIRIASGGELSRIMLAIKCVMNQKDGVPTTIFDEVDTGISGKTSRKIGIRLADMAKNRQIICITHSAQVASLGEQHLHISKQERGGRAFTSVDALEGEARVCEIARILGGIHITEAQMQAARDMLCAKDRE